MMNLKPVPFYSAALSSRKTCYVLLPPGYDQTDKSYPVIYLLHGMFGTETDWVQKGNAQETALRMMRDGELPESIVVMPNDGEYHTGTFYVDWYDGTGNYEQYFIYDLIPAIDSQFRTIKSREGRLIAGLSMGGYGAFVLSLRNPGLFGAAASLSGAVGSLAPGRQADELSRIIGPIHGPYAKEHNLALLAEQRANAEEGGPELYFDCGKDDFLYEGNVWFKQQLENMNYPFTFREFEGSHTWEYWTEHLQDVLRFFGQYLAGRAGA